MYQNFIGIDRKKETFFLSFMGEKMPIHMLLDKTWC